MLLIFYLLFLAAKKMIEKFFDIFGDPNKVIIEACFLNIVMSDTSFPFVITEKCQKTIHMSLKKNNKRYFHPSF